MLIAIIYQQNALKIIAIAALLYLALTPYLSATADASVEFSKIERYFFEELNHRNRKQDTPIHVSILTIDDKSAIDPIIEMISEINKITGKTIFLISEIRYGPNDTPSKNINNDTDMIIIKGTKFMSVNISWFVFNIDDFIKRYGNQSVNSIYDELASQSYICRQYEWREREQEGDKFLSVIDDGLGYQSFLNCTATFLLRASGIFPDSKKETVVNENHPGNFTLSILLNRDLITALKVLYDNRIKRGQDAHDMSEALRAQ